MTVSSCFSDFSASFAHPIRVAFASQARQADQAAIQDLHIPSLVLMENASAFCAHWIESLFAQKQLQNGPVWFFCGPGNNGADGLAMARLLALHHHPVRIYLDSSRLSVDEAVQLSIVKALDLPVFSLEQGQADLKGLHDPGSQKEAFLSAACSSQSPALLVDALFGNGLSRNLEEPWLSLIETINATNVPVFSIDLPSGIDANHGGVRKAAIQADFTAALDCLKWGHLLGKGRQASGMVLTAGIGIPPFLHEQDGSVCVLNKEMAAALLPKRTLFGNKGRFGKVLLAGGSFSMQGALAMAAKACFHSGCGTLTLFTPQPAAKAIASKMDLAMILSAPADEEGFFAPGCGACLEQRIAGYSCLGCGNGMGQGPGALEVLQSVLNAGKPAVLDADALNLLAQSPSLIDSTSAPLILCPHMMEFARLCGRPLDEVLAFPLELGRAFVQRHPHCVLVLKSDFTLILSTAREAVINRPDSALSKGGSGDVLCGIITGLYSMQADPFAAAAAGAWIHNAAAARARSPYSFTPLDLIEELAGCFEALTESHRTCEEKTGSSF